MRRLERLATPLVTAVVMLAAAQVVGAAPPDANFTATPSSPQVNESVTFDATASDPDGIASYQWDFDHDGTFSPDATGQSVSHSFTTPGPMIVALRVTDAADPAEVRNVTKTITVRDVPNDPPTAAFTFAPDPPNPGEQVTFNGTTSTDPDGSIVSYSWDLDNDNRYGEAGETGESPTATYATPGPHAVDLRVTDNDGATNTETRVVTVNSPPTAAIDASVNDPLAGQTADVPLLNLQTVTLDGSGSTDAEGGITYTWDFDGDGFDDGSTAQVTHPVFTTPGNHTIRLQVTDARGLTDIESRVVRANRAPVAGFVYTPETPVVGEQIQFSSTATDPDEPLDAIRSYRWDLDGDNQFGEAGETGASPRFAFSSAGTKTVRLVATDGGGIGAVAEQRILVQNTAPVGNFSFGPTAPLPGQPVSFRSLSRPSAGKQITNVQWDFSYQRGAFREEDRGASVHHAFGTPGPRLVALRVTESGGGYDLVVRAVNVNAAPIADFGATPGTPLTDSVVTLASTARDPDGPLTSQTWDLDGDGRYDDASGPVASRTFRGAGIYSVGLRVTDSKGAAVASRRQLRVLRRPLAVISGVFVTLEGRATRRGTRVSGLFVKAPKGSVVTVRCRGKSCPRRAQRRKAGVRRLRFRKFQGPMRARTKIAVKVARRGLIAKYTVFRIRRRLAPVRRDLCVRPGKRRAERCPTR